MQSADIEQFLARLYTDRELLDRFLADPAGEARRAGLDDGAVVKAMRIDRAGLRFASTSFEKKRRMNRAARSWIRRVFSR